MKGFNKGSGPITGGTIRKGFIERLDDLAQVMTRKFQEIDDRSISRGTYNVTAGDVEHGVAEIRSGLTEVKGHMIQIFRGGHIVTQDAFVTLRKNGMVGIESGERSYILTKGDIIVILVW